MNEILSFIENFKSFEKTDKSTSLSDTFLYGYCYYFALILKSRFPKGDIYYIPIYNHFVFKYEDNLYDISGIIVDEEKINLAEPWEQYKEKDKLETERIIRDCINKIS